MKKDLLCACGMCIDGHGKGMRRNGRVVLGVLIEWVDGGFMNDSVCWWNGKESRLLASMRLHDSATYVLDLVFHRPSNPSLYCTLHLLGRDSFWRMYVNDETRRPGMLQGEII